VGIAAIALSTLIGSVIAGFMWALLFTDPILDHLKAWLGDGVPLVAKWCATPIVTEVLRLFLPRFQFRRTAFRTIILLALLCPLVQIPVWSATHLSAAVTVGACIAEFCRLYLTFGSTRFGVLFTDSMVDRLIPAIGSGVVAWLERQIRFPGQSRVVR
jgi:hypothetical protein